jgi:peptidyl-dipeptidase Dcp
LGYKSHSNFVWKNEWLKILKKCCLLNDLLEKAKPAAQKEFVQLTAFAKEPRRN